LVEERGIVHLPTFVKQSSENDNEDILRMLGARRSSCISAD
jgi:hypothetical protein